MVETYSLIMAFLCGKYFCISPWNGMAVVATNVLASQAPPPHACHWHGAVEAASF